MTKQKKVVSVLSTSAISGLVASALMTSQAFAAVDAYTVKVGGDVYQYSKTELMESYLDSTEGTKAPLFEDFQAKLTEAKSVYAYHDDKNGYVTAQSVFDKYLENEKNFNLDQFTESKEAKVVEVPTVKKAVVKDGEIKYEDQNNNTGEDDKVKVTSVSAINLKQLKIEFANKVTDSDLKKDVEDIDNYTLEDKDGDEVDSDMIKEVKLDDSKKFAVLTLRDKVDTKGKYLIENQEDYTLVIDEDVTGEEYRTKDLVLGDETLPEVEKVDVVGKDTIKVTFSEPVKPYNIEKISDDYNATPELDDDDFEIENGDLSISRVELVNNNREANIIVGTDFKDGEKVKVRIKSSITDYAGLAVISKNVETATVKEDKSIPKVIGFKDVDTEDLKIGSGKIETYEKVTLVFDKDIKFKNMDDTTITNDKDLENYYHTSDKSANRAKMVKVDGKELTLYFEDDSFGSTSTNIYVKSGAIESRWEVENEKVSQRIEKEKDDTAPEVKKVEQHEDYNNKIKIKFSEKVKSSNDTDDGSARKKKNYTLKDKDGKEWKIDKVEKDGSSEKEFIITTTKDLDDGVKYKLTVENIEDKAGNAIKKVTKEFEAKDNDGVSEGDITVKVYSAGTSSQKMVVDFDTKMKMDKSRYSVKDLSKYTLIARDKKGVLVDAFEGKSSINLSDMYKADVKSAKNDNGVEINLPSKEKEEDLKDKQYNFNKFKNDSNVELYLQIDRVEDANGNVTDRNFEVKIDKKDFLGKGEEGSITFDDDDDTKPQIISPEDILVGFDDKVNFELKDIRVVAAEDETQAKAAADLIAAKKDIPSNINARDLKLATHKLLSKDGDNTVVKLIMDKDLRDKRYDDDDVNHIFTYDGKYQPTKVEDGKIVDDGKALNVYIFAVSTKTVNGEDVSSTKNDYDETLMLGSKGLVAVDDSLAPSIVDNDIKEDGYKYKNVDNDDEAVEYWQNGTDAAIVLTFEEAIAEDTLSRSTFELNEDDFCDAKIDSVKAYGNKVVIMLKDVKDGDDDVTIGDGFEILQKAAFEDMNENEVTGLKLQVGDFSMLKAEEVPGMKVVNKDALNKAIADADKLVKDQDNYTPETWAPFEKALTKAKEVAKNEIATETEVKTATETLTDAMNKLANKVNKESLTKAITEAKAIKPNGYTVESFKVLTDAITSAEAVVANKEATQEQIDAAIKALDDAKKGLVGENQLLGKARAVMGNEYAEIQLGDVKGSEITKIVMNEKELNSSEYSVEGNILSVIKANESSKINVVAGDKTYTVVFR